MKESLKIIKGILITAELLEVFSAKLVIQFVAKLNNLDYKVLKLQN